MTGWLEWRGTLPFVAIDFLSLYPGVLRLIPNKTDNESGSSCPCLLTRDCALKGGDNKCVCVGERYQALVSRCIHM